MRCGVRSWRGLVRDWEAIGDRLLVAACFDAVRCSVRPSLGVPCARGRRMLVQPG
jgi:hypothetical protein